MQRLNLFKGCPTITFKDLGLLLKNGTNVLGNCTNELRGLLHKPLL